MMDMHCGDRCVVRERMEQHDRIDPAGKSADNTLIANALPYLLNRLFNHQTRCPCAIAATNAKQKIADQLLALWRMCYLWMKL